MVDVKKFKNDKVNSQILVLAQCDFSLKVKNLHGQNLNLSVNMIKPIKTEVSRRIKGEEKGKSIFRKIQLPKI